MSPIDFFGEQRLKLALEVSQTGTFLWDMDNNSLHWDEHLYKLFDRDPSDAVVSIEDFLGHVHPEDLEKVLTQVNMVVTANAPGAGIFRTVTSRGDVRWLYDRARCFESEGKKFILGACIDVTDFKLIEQDLQHAKAAAESASESKSRFLANISHEIKTPLAAIVSSASVLVMENEDLDEEARNRTLDIIMRNSNHLQDIINDVLDISKIEAGVHNLVLKPVHIKGICQDVYDIFHLAANEKGIVLQFSVEPKTPVQGVTDARKVKQILLNLVGNAIKFTRTGRVTLTVKPAAKGRGDSRRQLAFLVTDTGIGIAQYDSQEIFAPFTQADSSVTRKFTGTGLGLTISRRLARALGGDVILCESIVGKGSCFQACIDFPAAEPLSKLASR